MQLVIADERASRLKTGIVPIIDPVAGDLVAALIGALSRAAGSYRPFARSS